MNNRPVSSPAVIEGLWNFFASVRLTVVVLIALAMLSIIGTLIPQNLHPEEYFHTFGPFYFQVMAILDIFDMYHSWWFQSLILLLNVNIVVCSIDRLQKSWGVLFPKVREFNLEQFRQRKSRVELKVQGRLDQLQESYRAIVAKGFSFSRIEQSPSGVIIFAERGRWTRLGVYIVHLSVVVLLIGALVGSRTGFDGYVNIVEGQSTDTIELRSGGALTLPFTIRCDDFNVQFYEGGQRPKEFRSSLTILEKGQPVLQKHIVVNDPLSYKGINIYQSSYGKAEGAEESAPVAPREVSIVFRSQASGMEYDRKMILGQSVALPEGLGTFTLVEYRPAAEFMNTPLGPSLVGKLSPKEGKEETILLPLRFPKFDAMRRGQVVIVVTDALPMGEPRYYTGLQVNRDPGVPLVYTGFILMIVGCMVTFFMSHQRLVVELQPGDGSQECKLMLSGTANKNKFAFKEKLQRLARTLAAFAEKGNSGIKG
jgi:cytochrome c biogenesis protein